MDPNEALRKLRELVMHVQGGVAPEELVEQFETQFEALDNWLTRGGFPPEAWSGPAEIVALERRPQ